VIGQANYLDVSARRRHKLSDGAMQHIAHSARGTMHCAWSLLDEIIPSCEEKRRREDSEYITTMTASGEKLRSYNPKVTCDQNEIAKHRFVSQASSMSGN
jgi:hypothetical protein